jgi:hypothetical protein
VQISVPGQISSVSGIRSHPKSGLRYHTEPPRSQLIFSFSLRAFQSSPDGLTGDNNASKADALTNEALIHCYSIEKRNVFRVSEAPQESRFKPSRTNSPLCTLSATFSILTSASGTCRSLDI